MPSPDTHRAAYDANGDIVIPSDDGEMAPPQPPRAYRLTRHAHRAVCSALKESRPAHPHDAIRKEVAILAGTLLCEGTRQYRSSAAEVWQGIRAFVRSLPDLARRLRRFAVQPVWIPGRRKAVQRSRIQLFAIDVLRFGGTFAVIFGVLFAALNYQSFFQILRAQIDPLEAVRGKIAQQDVAGLGITPAFAAGQERTGSLLDHVPPVGPPMNRLIIPKLDLNVPIVIPSMDALIAQDWAKLEEHIQTALQDGVVQYPGTAKPGRPGNFFVTGHSSYYPFMPGHYKSVFARLHLLEPGDEYWVYYGGDRFRYRVTEKKEVYPSDVTVLDQPTRKRIATLMTCTPVGTTLRRLIIRAQEIDPVTAVALEVGDHQTAVASPTMGMELLPI